MNENQDNTVMAQVANGDLDQSRILFDRYHLYLYNFFLKRRHSTVVSEDLTQNVFERLLRYRKTYKGNQSFKAWLFTIAHNVEADHFRKSKIKLNQNVELSQLSFSTDTVLDKIEKKEAQQKLEKAIALLNKEEQKLLHLSKFQSMKYAEIASVLQLSESAVKVKIHRAMKKLRVHYQKLATS